MQGTAEKAERKQELHGEKKKPVHKPTGLSLSEGIMIVDGKTIEERARTQNAASVKLELAAILARIKRKKAQLKEKKPGKKISDDPLPPDKPGDDDDEKRKDGEK